MGNGVYVGTVSLPLRILSHKPTLPREEMIVSLEPGTLNRRTESHSALPNAGGKEVTPGVYVGTGTPPS